MSRPDVSFSPLVSSDDEFEDFPPWSCSRTCSETVTSARVSAHVKGDMFKLQSYAY